MFSPRFAPSTCSSVFSTFGPVFLSSHDSCLTLFDLLRGDFEISLSFSHSLVLGFASLLSTLLCVNMKQSCSACGVNSAQNLSPRVSCVIVGDPLRFLLLGSSKGSTHVLGLKFMCLRSLLIATVKYLKCSPSTLPQ